MQEESSSQLFAHSSEPTISVFSHLELWNRNSGSWDKWAAPNPVTIPNSVTPPRERASICLSRSRRPARVIRHFGWAFVPSPKRLPLPAARIMALTIMMSQIVCWYLSDICNHETSLAANWSNNEY